jgi:hypothetical protein
VGAVRRGLRFWIRTAALIALAAILGVVIFLFMKPFLPLGSSDIVIIAPPELQPTIEYLSAHPEDAPESFRYRPLPGDRAPSSSWVSFGFLPCESEGNRAGLPPEQNHCGHDAIITVDGKVVRTEPYVLGLAAQRDGHWYGSVDHRLVPILTPGQHFVTIEANIIGRHVIYSWVWTVE